MGYFLRVFLVFLAVFEAGVGTMCIVRHCKAEHYGAGSGKIHARIWEKEIT